MKKISVIIISLLVSTLMAVFALAQDKGVVPIVEKETPKKTDTDAKGVEPNYMLLGLQVPFLYYPKDKKSTMNYGAVFKAPAGKDFGAEIALNDITVPIKEYTVGAITYTGAGEEEFTNFRLDMLYFFRFYRPLQFKLGFDYYKFAGGFIQNNLGTETAGLGVDCGTTYILCKRCVGDQYGLNIGLNFDVNLYRDFYILSSLGYRYILTDNDALKWGMVDFTIGLGYKI